MQKIFSLTISFIVCFIFGIADVWPWFALAFVLLSFPNVQESMWEIPLGAMAISVLSIFCRDYTGILTASLIISASAIFAVSKPQKLFIFYPLAAISLFLFPTSESAVYAMSAAFWCACKYLLCMRRATTV